MILGITGCPGSGKSALAGVIAERGWTLVNADRLGKELVEGNAEILAELSRLFGSDIIGPEGNLDRRLLARRAFSSAEDTGKLNRAVHPALIRKVSETIEALRMDGNDVVVDCALIFEWEIGDRFDRIVCVRAGEAVRRKRLMERDRRSPEDIDRLFAAQLPESVKALRSHIVLANNGSLKDIVIDGLMLAELPKFGSEAERWMKSLPREKNG
ncbi:MAG: dephospho-CoA kinase [Candidatus Latescibacterota bacterium]